ncbi:MAG: hypothetical protein H6917_05995 [Novosphingobium sp.]|nr:hypothetical protein [Novosphingobium sp.]MCP5401921.1 hypothetical protein [Novosphingobium sp.]
MARLFLSPGQTYGTVGPFSNTDVIGTNDFETVFVSDDGLAIFDPSFNRGGDVISIGGVAEIYDGSLSGSNLILTADNGAFISIPVGGVGATIIFADNDARTLIFDGTNVILGDQTIPGDGSTVDLVPGPEDADPVFTASTAAGADVLGITGSKSVRVDLTPTHDQITGIDENGDGVIAPDGVENNPTTDVDAIDFEIIDAYLRDHLNYYNTAENFLGNLYVDGTGFAGDGIKDGNIILSGLGADIIFGGIGNDFIAGGGIAPQLPAVPTGDPIVDALNAILQSLNSNFSYDYQSDNLSGGRNADFFFAEFSTLSLAAGDALFIDAGTTADDTSAATGDSFFEGFVIPGAGAADDFFYYFDYNSEYENHNYYPISSQDSDWFLPEVSDDEEPIVIELREGDAGRIFSEDQVSKIFANIFDVENLDASGNLYGFVDDLDVALGENGMVVDGENVGIGSSAQLLIDGSEANNIIIGGYDNDRIYGNDGWDLLFGGNLKYALNNPNAAGIINDGIDLLYGGRGDDDIVFEADGGIISGGREYDTLWLTNQSLGWNNDTGDYQTADNITDDGVLRFDLEADGLEDEEEEFGFQTAGYGGADVDGTHDQTNYGGDGVNPNAYRVEITGMNAVDATGMGTVDYVAAGGNPTMNPDPAFRNQQNHFAYEGDLDLRGTMGDNDLFASTGDDVLEGRKGDDWLMGGGGTDDFLFSIDGDTIYDMEDGLGEDFIEGKWHEPTDICDLDQLGPDNFGEDECNYKGSGDGLDAILRKYDANGDNLWDTMDAEFIATYGEGDFVGEVFEAGQDVITNLGNRYWDIDGDGLYDLVAFGVAEDMDEQPFPQVLWSQDFGLDDVATGNPSFLTIDFGDTNFSDPNVLITNFSIEIGGEVFAVNSADLAGVQNAAEIAAIVNDRFSQQDADVSVTSSGNKLLITDAAGREMSDELSEGFIVSFALSNSFSEVFAMFSDQPPTIVEDRLIFKSYEDRSDNEGVDDDAITGSLITLGHDGYAEDLVVGFDKDGTRLAEDQFFDIRFGNLTTEDKVTITINNVQYCLQVGVALDGTQVDDEDGVNDSQESIQDAFLERLADFINTFMDDDTAAGYICAEYDPGGVSDSDRVIRISQHAYAGEETVFIHAPTVEIENLSGGEDAFAEIINMTETEVFLFGFDGRNGNLHEDNVQFVGQEDISRSDLETASNAGETLIGKEAVVIDAHSDDLVMADGTDIPVNLAIDDELNDKVEVDDELTDNFSVHGDDNQITGNGDDTVDGRTGDDFVRGSLGNDELDGGNDWYAVKYVGEDDYRVTYLSAYEAYLLDGDPDVADIAVIRQTENGLNTIGGTGLQPVPSAPQFTAYFSDTLQYQQEDIDKATGKAAGTARFLVELDDFIQVGGSIIFDKGGAGHVTVDEEGDGFANDADNYQHFQNFENLRVVSGVNKAVAGNGQGNDDLDLSALSDIADQETGGDDTVQDIGICYDLTDSPSAGGVFIIEDLDNDGMKDGTRAVMRVDGVENVYFGDGDDTIQVDETEVAKDNIFDGDDGEDTVEYYNNFVTAGSSAEVQAIELTNGTLTGGDVLSIAGFSIGNGAQDIVVGSNVSNDVVGSAVSAYFNSNLGALSLALGRTVSSVSYNAGSNLLSFNYATSAGNVPSGLLDVSYLNLTTSSISWNINDAGGSGHIDGVSGTYNLEPQLTLVIESSTDTDEAIFTGGRLGDVVATDTLISFENIGLYGQTARAPGAEDVLDVTNVSSDVTIDLTSGEVFGGSTLLATIMGASEPSAGIVQFENFQTDGGDDLLIVADAEEMCCNVNSDVDTLIPLEFDTYMNYDILDDDCVRQSVADLRAANRDDEIPTVTNFALFTFDLGDGDEDRVDYSQTSDSIAALVKVEQGVNYIFVDDDVNDNGLNSGTPFDSHRMNGSLSEDCDRVDALIGVEEIVASNTEGGDHESLLDFTALGEDSVITFQFDEGNTGSGGHRHESVVRIGDADNNEIDGIPNYIEYWDLDNDENIGEGDDAVWTRVEGGDTGEHVIYEASDDLVNFEGVDHRYTNDELNLRGGENRVSYNDLVTSISATLTIDPSDGVDPNSGVIEGMIRFQDGTGNVDYDTPPLFTPGDTLSGSGVHTINSHAADNKVSAGSLEINASQDAEDCVAFEDSGDLIYELGTSPGVILVDAGAPGTLKLTGFEVLKDDGQTDDCYYFENYNPVEGNLVLFDSGSDDHDTIKINNDAVSVGADTNISLAEFEADFFFDWDVLDITAIDDDDVTEVIGSGGPSDELAVGIFNNIDTITSFDSLILTEATITENGPNFTIDTTTDELLAGARTVALDGDWGNGTFTGGILSFSGSLGDNINDPCANSWIASATSGVTVDVIGNDAVAIYGGDGDDTITGAGGMDRLYGGLGADTLDGSFVPAVGEVQTITFSGQLGGNDFIVFTGPGGTLEVGGSGSAAEYTLTNAINDADQIGSFLAALPIATIEMELGYAPGSIASVEYDALTNELSATFVPTADFADIVATLDDGGNGVDVTTVGDFTGGQTTAYAPQSYSMDTFVYCEAAESVDGSMDTILNFDNIEVQTVRFSADGTTINGGDTITIGGISVGTTGGQDVVVTAGDEPDAIGTLIAAYANASSANMADFLSGVSGVSDPAQVSSFVYNAESNTLEITFEGAGDVGNTAMTVVDSTGGTISVTRETGGTGTSLDFVGDKIDLSELGVSLSGNPTDLGTSATYANLLSAASASNSFNSGDEIAFGHAAGDTYIFVDVDSSGEYTAGDMVIKLDDFTAALTSNNFIL